MRPRLALLVLLLAVPVVLAAARTNANATPATVACGVENWPMKTLSDPQRGLVQLRPKATTVEAINRLPMPHPTPTRRSTAFQRHVWEVLAQIVEYRLEPDDDIHLILYGGNGYVSAEMPAPNCLSRKARDRRAIVRVRRLFESRCGAATSLWRDLGAVAYVSGVGFWDFPHGQHGHAGNYAELHPVTGLRLIAGCA